MKRVPENFVFMKVGEHARESFNDILKRKKEEYKNTGKIFWGYGGTTLHPTKTVQPFMKTYQTKSGIHLLMQVVKSNADPDLLPAQEYSVDGTNWLQIPDGINVLGSRYALVLGEIKPDSLKFTLDQYEVAEGRSKGKLASDYLKGRIDKGCFIKSAEAENSNNSDSFSMIQYTAKIVDPYAVFLR